MRRLNAQTWTSNEVVEAAADRADLDRYHVWRLEHLARKDGTLRPDQRLGEGLIEWTQVRQAKAQATADGHPLPPTFLSDDDWLIFITVPIVEA